MKHSIRNLIDPNDLSILETQSILDLAIKIMDDTDAYHSICEHKILATLFFEPSTRTRLSFESAMLSLGGSVLGFSDANATSVSKGESLGDTIQTVSCYSDIIAMRHPQEGAAVVATQRASIPIINAGDGGHNHPTQTLADLLTILKEKGRLDHVTIGFCGDLKFGRTVHSLVRAMAHYEAVTFVFIAPEELAIPAYIKSDILDPGGIAYKEVESMEAVIGELDILYMTRVQKERFSNIKEYQRLKDTYILNLEKLAKAKKNLSILHPLPRVNEIAIEVDSDARACYFKQVLNGKFVRMALIIKLLGLDDDKLNGVQTKKKTIITSKVSCENSHCITASENVEHLFYLANEAEGTYRCLYCDSEVKAIK